MLKVKPAEHEEASRSPGIHYCLSELRKDRFLLSHLAVVCSEGGEALPPRGLLHLSLSGRTHTHKNIRI